MNINKEHYNFEYFKPEHSNSENKIKDRLITLHKRKIFDKVEQAEAKKDQEKHDKIIKFSSYMKLEQSKRITNYII